MSRNIEIDYDSEEFRQWKSVFPSSDEDFHKKMFAAYKRGDLTFSSDALKVALDANSGQAEVKMQPSEKLTEYIDRIIAENKKILEGSSESEGYTAGRYDPIKKEWVTTEADPDEGDPDETGFTVGKWDSGKKRWVREG